MRSVRLAAVSSGWMSMTSDRMIAPSSRPSLIRMIWAPVWRSPAMMARWIGAAPRQRGSSEPCRLKQPRRGASSTSGLRIWP
ncbi:hypothetical protein D3C72_1241230 [compost metagenome]